MEELRERLQKNKIIIVSFTGFLFFVLVDHGN